MCARLVLGAVFIGFAWPKILDPSQFYSAVRNYRMLPEPFGVGLAAALLPFVELFAGLMLISGYRRRAGAALCLCMGLVFEAAMIVSLARGLNISCGCYNQPTADPLGWWELVRTGLLVLAAVVVLYMDDDPLSIDRLRGAPRSPWDPAPSPAQPEQSA